MQGNLIPNPPEEEDQTPKPGKWHNFKYDTWNTGHLHTSVCGAICVQPTNNAQLPNLCTDVKIGCASELTTLSYISESSFHYTVGKKQLQEM